MVHLPLLASLLAIWAIPSVQAACAPISGNGTTSSTFWMADATLHQQGRSPFNSDSSYKVFRNVKDFGAVGDGVHDDTAAFNNAISSGGRCGRGCSSSTITPGLVYVPPGTYRLTSPIIPYYFTSLVGDYNNKPILKADSGFTGIAVIDADPYMDGGANWWTNQNNFFRSIRNFVIDTTAMPAAATGTGIHWQVGQATSLINIDFRSSTASGNNHQGIFAENGSGGFLSDLTFNGGKFGMWISNQQFTIRNIKISNAATGIFQLWNWGFTWTNVQISNCQIGWDIQTGGTTSAQAVGSVLIVDSTISSSNIGIHLSTSQPSSLAGSLILDNVAFSGITTANIQDGGGNLVPASSGTVRQWFQGNIYTGSGGRTYTRGTYSSAPTKPAGLLDSSGKIFGKSRPQYNTFTPGQFLSIKARGGAKGDGVTDDSDAINKYLAANAGCGIIFFDAGVYLVTKTIFVPAGTRIVGEMFSTILASGSAFSNQNSPTPVLKVGNAGDSGLVEISDIVITTKGGSQGAIGVEWNIAASSQGSTGMWDVHVRLGGTKGTNVDIGNCPTGNTDVSRCGTSFLGIHITPSGSGYFENVWVWNADHDLDDQSQRQINAYSGRGILVESVNPTWLVGTAAEHHVQWQYAFLNAQNLFAGLIQTETPYFQPTPAPPFPFSINTKYGDPNVSTKDAYGLVVTNSKNIFVYGAGLYSFFQNYNQACVDTRSCQTDMVLVDSASTNVFIYQLSTTSSTNMITRSPNTALVKDSDNINGYASTVTLWRSN